MEAPVPLLDQISDVLKDTSSRGIARAVTDLIAAGKIPPGSQLPTTRELADAVGVSAGTISDSWRILVSYGLLETRGRRGTFVVESDASAPWRPFRHVIGSDLAFDLSTGFPDPEHLIDLRPYLSRLGKGDAYTGYPSHELDPLLAKALAAHLPLVATPDNTILATHVLGAMTELFPVLGQPFTKVVVGSPEFAPYLDLLERFRLEPLAVPMDDEGPVLDAVGAAVQSGARAIIVQPRVHNPSGIVTSRERLQAIAELCQQHDMWIVDGDFYGEILDVEPRSAAEWAPDQTVYIKAFSKDIHPDIRVAVMVGSPRLIGRVLRRRVGGFDVSRVNQDLLRLLLEDPERKKHTARVRSEYQRRNRVFVDTLGESGIPVRMTSGFNVWVPVDSERDAMVYLASKGIGVAPGSAFQTLPDRPHLRVSPIAISGDVREIALHVAEAAIAGRRRS
ncbi:MAG: PLP-dependent aminotransferase family protein [Pseudonocardia sp.]